MNIRHAHRYRHTPRGITPRRLAAARRALAREQESLALFAEEVAQAQPTAEQRILDRDALVVRGEQAMRDLEAKHWRWGRAQLQTIADELRETILTAWNASSVPAHGTYFASFVRTRLRKAGVPFDDT